MWEFGLCWLVEWMMSQDRESAGARGRWAVPLLSACSTFSAVRQLGWGRRLKTHRGLPDSSAAVSRVGLVAGGAQLLSKLERAQLLLPATVTLICVCLQAMLLCVASSHSVPASCTAYQYASLQWSPCHHSCWAVPAWLVIFDMLLTCQGPTASCAHLLAPASSVKVRLGSGVSWQQCVNLQRPSAGQAVAAMQQCKQS